MDDSGEAGVSLVVASGEAPELLEALEAVLDEMAPSIHVLVVRDRRITARHGRNNSESATLGQFGPQCVVVERLVGEECIELDVFDQRRDTDAVMTLAGQQDEANQIAEGIDESHDLRRQPAARFAYGLIESPPFAPLPCRWTFTMVPSMSAYSKSGSPDMSLKIVSNTPLSAQRRNRLHTEDHFPNSGGRSRQGEPVRTTHRIASKNKRLSAPERPGSPSLPGRSGAIRSHWASLKAKRIKAALHFSALNQGFALLGIPLVTNVYRP
jgi:hypothetical protein